MSEKVMLNDVPIPQTVDEALKVAQSLVNWLEWIKKEGSMSSNGGWIELHVLALKCFVHMETIKASSESLLASFGGKM
jgi:hypothetical protein